MLSIVAGMVLFTAPLARAMTDSDKSINDKIFQMLMTDKSLAKGSHKAQIAIHNGEVTLTGDVTTEAKKEQLHKAIAGVPGVQRVNDSDLVLDPSPAGRFGEGLP